MKEEFCMKYCLNDCKFEQPEDGSHIYWQCGRKLNLTEEGKVYVKDINERIQRMEAKHGYNVLP